MKKTLSVAAIKNGTVIDHIDAGNALKIIKLLRLPSEHRLVTTGLNLPSKAMGKKDIIKVEGRELTEKEVNTVAILAPKASVNIIKNYEVKKKIPIHIPEIIEQIIKCPNPTCICNNEKMDTKFHTEERKKELRLTCHYCEKQFKKEEIKEYNE